MLFLWHQCIKSKLACRCSPYLPFMKAIARTRLGTPTKRKIPLGDVFTAFYSTILATAAVADSTVKDKRMRDWDRIIAEAREELSAKEDSLEHTQQLGQGSELADSMKSSSFTNTYNSGSEDSASTINDQTSPSHLRKHNITSHFSPQNSSQFALPDDAQSISSSADGLSVMEKFVHEEPDPDIPERNISDAAELKLLQVNINNLVARLLASSTFYWSASIAVDTDNDCDTRRQLEILKQRIQSLELSFEQLPLYSNEGPEFFQQQAKELNAILWSICRKARSEEMSLNLMIAKICFNLLISAIPPNIETYNILLHQFALLERYDLADHVLESFWQSRLRPNKTTIELIILHYKSTGNKDGLTRIVKEMRGASGDLMLTATKYAKNYRLQWPSVEGYQSGSQQFEPDNPMVRQQMKMHKLFYRSGYFYKKSPRDRHIFDALITAHLQLKGLRSAVRYFAAAVREGSKIKTGTLCSLIDLTIQRADFTTGLKLLMVILSQWKTSGCNLYFPFTLAVRCDIKRLLFFCGIDANRGINGHLPSRIKKYTEEMILQELEYPKEALRKMLCHMKIQSLRESLYRHSLLMGYVGKALKVGEPSLLSTTAIQEALDFMKIAAEKERKVEEEEKRSSDQVRGMKLKVHGLQANHVTSFSKLEEIATGLAMIRVNRCAVKLDEMAHLVVRMVDAEEKMQWLQNLSLHLGVLHMQLKVEIHLNIWWIRRLGLVASTFRSNAQRNRLNFIVQNLNIIECKTNTAWEELMATKGFYFQ